MDETEKRYNNVLTVIDKRLIPNEEAKKARGEVFTPLPLVREMLFGLRKSAIDAGRTEVWGVDESGRCIEDNESNRIGGIPLPVWRNPETTWLDPANGIGNFPVVAFYMLDYQLGEHGPSAFKGEDKKRYRRKHIVEKMLFMIELNKGNVNTSRKIFEQMVPGAKANICCADTLSMTDAKLKEVFDVNRFDVVMGNPPFNEGGTHQTGSAIWPYFIYNLKTYVFPGAINILNKNGFLLFIIPQGWRTPAYANVLEIMRPFNILTIVIIGTAQQAFKINFPVDYFVLEKKKSEVNTNIRNLDLNISEEVDIDKLPIIPNYGWSIFEKWQEMHLPRLAVTRSSSHTSSKKTIYNPKETSIFKYKIIKNMNAKGINIEYSSVKHPDQDKIKVLVAFGSYLYPYIDRGESGVSENVFYILCDTIKQAEIIKDFLDNKFIKCLVSALKVSSYAVSHKLLSYIPDPTEFTTTDLQTELFLTPKDVSFLETCRTGSADANTLQRRATTQKKPRISATERQVATKAERAETVRRKTERIEASAARKISRKATSLKKGGACSNRTRKVRRYYA